MSAEPSELATAGGVGAALLGFALWLLQFFLGRTAKGVDKSEERVEGRLDDYKARIEALEREVAEADGLHKLEQRVAVVEAVRRAGK